MQKHHLSWINTFNYKSLHLSISMRGAFGFQIINQYRMYHENPTISYNMLRAAHDPIDGVTQLSSPQSTVSHYIEDGDYWKFDNVTLAYTYTLNSSYLASVRAYVSGHNLYTLTKYRGIDPELSITGLEPGVDFLHKFPTVRTFTLGLDFRF